MTPEGSAMTATPQSEDIMLTIRPTSDAGTMSPYPTVVNVTVAQ